MAIDVTQFHQAFFEESLEGLDIMESALLSLDMGAPDMEAINTIFRAAHSIKGGSGTFGFSAVADFTHVLETLMDELRNGKRQVSQGLVDTLLASVDCLREMLQALQADTEIDAERVALLQRQLEESLAAKEAVGEPLANQPEAAAEAQASTPLAGWHIRFCPHSHLLQTGNDPVRIFKSLEELGELSIHADRSKLPSFDQLDPETCYLSWELELRGDIPRAEIAELFEWVEDDCDLEISPLDEEPGAEKSAPAIQPTTAETPVEEKRSRKDRRAATPDRRSQAVNRRSGTTSQSTSIRVDIDKIDALINMLGELVITQSMLNQMGIKISGLDAACGDELLDGLEQLESNVTGLQEAAMRIRMLPISFAFQRFPRMVRDTSQKLGKKVELKLSGEQTELDKTVMEKIVDPLVHLVRNAVDHGIETPEVRKAAGKPETGTVHLNAYHHGGNIVIEVSEDGAGLNRERILAKAVERGLVGENEELSDEKVYELVFQAGFSTATVVSDVSGRGVGMDVVRRNIRELGGRVEALSQPGRGSTFTIRLPLTLAVMDGQLIRIGDETFIIPLASIIESLQIQPESVNAIAGQDELYRLRDEYIPVIRLYDIFNVKPDTTNLAKNLLVIVEGADQKAGIVVDELLDQQQFVIKSLKANFKSVEGLAGATILGDGTVALILDIAGVIQLSRSKKGQGEALNAGLSPAA
jgi:two-component system chemotaxis sensor kinase CheA